MSQPKRWVDEVFEVLQELGGRASLEDIYKQIKQRGNMNFGTAKDWRKTVQRTIYEHSSDAEAFKGDDDLFAPVDEKGQGEWKLRSGNIGNFQWVSFFEELAREVLTYRDRQDELLSYQKRINELLGKDPLTCLDDKPSEGTEAELKEIDPFSFFGLITRFKDGENIRTIANFLTDEMNLDGPSFDSVDGLPRANPFQARFMPWKKDRSGEELNDLWELANQVVHNDRADVEPSLFRDCLRIHSVGLAKLTQGMFWLNPTEHFPVDTQTQPFLMDQLVDENLLADLLNSQDYTDYLSLVERVEDRFDWSLPELSYLGFKYKKSPSELASPFDQLFGEWSSAVWFFDLLNDSFQRLELEEGDPRITLSLVNNNRSLHFTFGQWLLLGFQSQDGDSPAKISIALREDLIDFSEPDEFTGNDAEIGDFTVDDEAPSVTLYSLPLELAEQSEEVLEVYQETLDLAKDQFEDWSKTPYRGAHLKELERGVREDDYRTTLFREGMDIAESDSDYWIFQANPEHWDLESNLKSCTVDEWSVRAHKDDISPDDKAILWQTGDKAGVYGLAEVRSTPYELEDPTSDEKVEVEVEENFVENPITKSELEDQLNLDDLNVGLQGTNFQATEHQYEAIKALRSDFTEQVADDVKSVREEPKYWKLSPGKRAKYWDEWKERDIISIGWDELRDISDLSREEFEEKKERLSEKYPEGNFDGTAPDQVWKFLHEIQPGDWIVANRGTTEVLGIGQVTGEYYVEPEADHHIHRREINWSSLETREVDQGGWRRTLISLDEEDFEAIRESGAKDWSSDIDVERINDSFQINGTDADLYFPEDMRDDLETQICSAISSGKHIVLVGPPGTGKSKLAKTICDYYLDGTGERDDHYLFSTATSDWTTFETVGGLRPTQDETGESLEFEPGLFLNCFRDDGDPVNRWLIIDEINRADIDKAFGSLFSVLADDSVTLSFNHDSGKSIQVVPQTTNTQETYSSISPHEYVMPDDWRLIATMNTYDKASLYEMSYAFMRRFAFIPVGIPEDLDEHVDQYLNVWDFDGEVSGDQLSTLWGTVNEYRSIGPALAEDIANHVATSGGDWSSSLIMYVYPQLEGLPERKIENFLEDLQDVPFLSSNDFTTLRDHARDFFGFETLMKTDSDEAEN